MREARTIAAVVSVATALLLVPRISQAAGSSTAEDCNVASMTAETATPLSHVWSDLYLDDAERFAWLMRRGLDSWSDGPWAQRGSENAADIIVVELSADLRVPRGIGVIDSDSVVGDFEWLFGMPPLHRREMEETERAVPTAPRAHVASTVKGDGPEGTRLRYA